MRNIYILYGPPLSGKTTFSNLIAKHDKDIKIVSRDVIRDNLNDHSNLPEIENIITKIEESYFSSLITQYDIICDNTFSKVKYIKDFLNLIKKSKIKTKVRLVDFSDIPFDTLLERSLNRDRKVDPVVIKKFFTRCKQNLKSVIELINNFNNDSSFISEYKPTIISKIPIINNNDRAIIVDIDGTLSHSGGLRSPFEYDKVINDDIDEIIRDIVTSYKNLNHKIIIVSGREDSCYNMTCDWLNKHRVPFDFLYMRKSKDFRKDAIVKKEIFDKYIKDNYNVVFCLDDRNQVVDMWRSIGIKCLQVQEGNF
jgi:adenylate kinase family enzyme